MRFPLDDLQRPLALGLASRAAESYELNEHQDLLERGAELVRHVRQEALPRVDEAYLAAERCKAGDGEHDPARQQQQGCRHTRLGDSSGYEVPRDVWFQ